MPSAPAPLSPLPPAHPGRLPSRLALIGAWSISLALLAALGWAAVVHREAVIRIWPPSQRAYLALGLAPPPPGPPAQ